MVLEINDEARRHDPVKQAAFAARTEQQKNKGNKEDNKKDGDKDRRGQNQKYNGTYCDFCKRTHFGGGPKCYWAHPELAPQGWRERNVERLKAIEKTVNAAAVHSVS